MSSSSKRTGCRVFCVCLLKFFSTTSRPRVDPRGEWWATGRADSRLASFFPAVPAAGHLAVKAEMCFNVPSLNCGTLAGEVGSLHVRQTCQHVGQNCSKFIDWSVIFSPDSFEFVSFWLALPVWTRSSFLEETRLIFRIWPC